MKLECKLCGLNQVDCLDKCKKFEVVDGPHGDWQHPRIKPTDQLEGSKKFILCGTCLEVIGSAIADK